MQLVLYLGTLVAGYGISFPREFSSKAYRKHHANVFAILAIILGLWWLIY